MAEDILLVLGMATCHELNIIEDLMLDMPLDKKMISSTEWSMEGGAQEAVHMICKGRTYISNNYQATSVTQKVVLYFSYSASISGVERYLLVYRCGEVEEHLDKKHFEEALKRDEVMGGIKLLHRFGQSHLDVKQIELQRVYLAVKSLSDSMKCKFHQAALETNIEELMMNIEFKGGHIIYKAGGSAQEHRRHCGRHPHLPEEAPGDPVHGRGRAESQRNRNVVKEVQQRDSSS